jgi:hypothetical protein
MPYLTGYGFISQAEYDRITSGAAPADTGTNAPVATTTQTQATPGTTTSTTSGPIPYEGVSSADSGETAFIAPQTAQNATTGLSSADLGTTATIAQDPYAGISSADLGTTQYIAPSKPGNNTNDDASTNNTKSGVNTQFNAANSPGNPIRPSPNVLDQFASYTYIVSLYLITPDQLKTLNNTAKINTNEWSLLMQSGGAAPPITPAAPPPPRPTPPATQTKPVKASYRPDGTVIDPAYNDAGF